MTVTYFASAGVLYAQEGGRCAKLMPSISGEFVQQDPVWVAVPVPDMAALHPTREAVPVADAPEVRYGTWTGGGRDTWRCECRTHYLLNDYQDHCHVCGTHRPA